MFPFASLHGFADDLVIGALDHMHWWLHLVVHIVVVGAPLALLAVLVTWCLQGLRRYRRSDLWDAAMPADLGRSALIPGIFRYLHRQTWRSQLWLLLGATLSLPILYATLELPKLIINNVIDSGLSVVRTFGTSRGVD